VIFSPFYFLLLLILIPHQIILQEFSMLIILFVFQWLISDIGFTLLHFWRHVNILFINFCFYCFKCLLLLRCPLVLAPCGALLSSSVTLIAAIITWFVFECDYIWLFKISINLNNGSVYLCPQETILACIWYWYVLLKYMRKLLFKWMALHYLLFVVLSC